MTKNQRFGILLANQSFKEKWLNIPFILNTEQAESFHKRYKYLERLKSYNK